MENIIKFIEDFLAIEYQAQVTRYIERDDDILRQKKEAVQRFLSCEVEVNLGRPLSPGNQWFEYSKKKVEKGSLIPRTLFQIKAYTHPVLGNIYRIYASSNTRPRGAKLAYFVNFFIANKGDGLKIVSRYDIDILPGQDGERLIEGNLSWIWHSGIKLDRLGKVIKVKKIKAPDKLEHLAEYEREPEY